MSVPEWRDIDPHMVGRRIKEARRAAGLSQRQLAFPGCTSAYISRLEAGQRTPSGHLLEELAGRIGTTVAWLLHGVDLACIRLDAALVQRAREAHLAEQAAWLDADASADELRDVGVEKSLAQRDLYVAVWEAVTA